MTGVGQFGSSWNQPSAPALSSPGQDGSAAFRLHPGPESMLALSRALGRLIGSFHESWIRESRESESPDPPCQPSRIPGHTSLLAPPELFMEHATLTMVPPQEAIRQLRAGAEFVTDEELRQKLEEGRPLRVKLGVDPTSPDLHLGHAIVLSKLRQFQDLGHEAILIIGDFTSMIGDPSGRSVTRPMLTYEEVVENAETYKIQAFKILDARQTRIVFNGEWLRKISFLDIIQLNSRISVQQLTQRDDFRSRIEQEQPVFLHELQYPLMQAWDSVQIRADVELGGTDQLFNIMVGRVVQRAQGQPQQVACVLPILEGLDGKQKMSKSLGNYVGIAEPPTSMVGKLMSISDELMARYYPLLLFTEMPAIHPLEAKKQLARHLVTRYHSSAAAEKALHDFEVRFARKDLAASELPELQASLLQGDIVSVVVAAYEQAFALPKSRSEARRLIEQGSVQWRGEKVLDPKAILDLQPGEVLRLDKTRAVKLS
jgi:tyrosyl-tRNA synthetase